MSSGANTILEFVIQNTTARRFNSALSFRPDDEPGARARQHDDRDLSGTISFAYDPSIADDAETERLARTLMQCAINFYRDFIEATKQPYKPSHDERDQLRTIETFLAENPEAPAEEIEKSIYDLGRANYDKPGKIFSLLYRVLLGQERGPRLGAFIRLATPIKIAETINAALASSAASSSSDKAS